MVVTVIALFSINESEPQVLGEYLRITTPLMDRAKARIVKRFKLCRACIGKRHAEMAVIVEFPDREAVDMVFKSDDYCKAAPFRDRAFLRYEILIGVGGDAPAGAAEAEQRR